MRKKSIVLMMAGLGLTLSLSSCTNTNPISFSDIRESNNVFRIEERERITVDLSAPCKEIDGEKVCRISKARLDAAANTITKLNDAREKADRANNALVDKLDHTEYASAAKDRAISDLKQQQNISTAMKWLERIGFIFGVWVFGNL